MQGGQAYELPGAHPEGKLWVKDGVALYVTGMGKVSAAIGTTASGDNYWKGQYDHQNALRITAEYGCPDPYAISEMEDVAVARAAARFGMLDRLILLRTAVNMDVFMGGATPESLWLPEYEDNLASESNAEAADIFAPAMKNVFDVGSVIMEAILSGKLQ